MRRLLSCFRRLWSDRSGNIALIFALAVVPVMGAMGAAVDYSIANANRTAMQAALDNTGLMLSKMMPLSQTDLNTKGWQIFTGNLGNSPVVMSSSSLVIDASTTGKLVLDVSGTYTVGLGGVLQLVGMNPSFPVGAHAEVQWGNSRLRVALVLDNTGSMSQSNKIGALKTATTNLITQLQAAANVNGDVYVSIIPFVKNVNVGSSNYAANWIDSTGWKANNGSCSTNGSTQSTCQTAHCSNSQYKTKSTCQSHSATWYNAGTWTPKTFNSTNWNGCVTDRGVSGGPGTGADYDQNVNTPNPGVTASLFPAEQYSSCPLQMMGLSYDWTSLKNLVSLMSPNGSTNQPIGLVWGWQSLVGGGPFPAAPAFDPNYTYNQVIILLSDGLNTQDRWYGDGMNTSTQVDNRMYYQSGSTVSGTCKNIKDQGITIYTVQVNTGGDPTSVLLQNCATDSSKFFLLTSSSEIVTTFQQIGTALANLHLSK